MASIIVVASIGLLSVEEIVFLIRVRAWVDLGLAALTFVLTIFLGVELGIGISIAISILFVLKHSSVPSVILLGRLPETNKFRDVAMFKEAELQNGFIIVRLDESLYFANIGQLQSVLDRLERFGAPHAHPSEVEKEKTLEGVVLHISNVVSIDASALESLHTTVEDYSKRQIRVAFVKARSTVRSSLLRAGIATDNQIGSTFFDTVHDAIEFMRTAKEVDASAPI
jgi:MFS superfamily sulfate permease-like transporter